MQPEDLRARTKKFAVDIIGFARQIPPDRINNQIAAQLADAATALPQATAPYAAPSRERTSSTNSETPSKKPTKPPSGSKS
jgi:hypothetical protein